MAISVEILQVKNTEQAVEFVVRVLKETVSRMIFVQRDDRQEVLVVLFNEAT
ncbi:MAG: hypothetical protein ABI477_22540 [Chryseolinea sp.]